MSKDAFPYNFVFYLLFIDLQPAQRTSGTLTRAQDLDILQTKAKAVSNLSSAQLRRQGSSLEVIR